MKSESMKPTELTMGDVLLQEVANAIRLIKQFKEVGGTILQPATDVHALRVRLESLDSAIRFSSTSDTPIGRFTSTHNAFSEIHHGYLDSSLSVTAIIARHRAVWHALCDLHPNYPGPDTLSLQQLVWDEFPENLSYRVTSMPETPRYTDSQVIPQLGVYASSVVFGRPHCLRTHSIHTPLWQVREQERFAHGIYIPLPDEFAELLPKSVHDNQFPHLAAKDSNTGMVAYTQSPVAGALDRQQVQKPGRYIRMHRHDLTDEQVKQAAAVVLGSLHADFYHTKDPDEIHRVYMEGPQSCMTAEGRFDHLWVDGKQYHPAMVYAHPKNNLELVYLEVNGRIGARTLVNTAKKTYVRIYAGDSVAGANRRMKTYLESIGYRQCDYTLMDEELLRVSPDDDPDAIICPYLDPSNMGVSLYADYLLIGGDDEYTANYETGCLTEFDYQNRTDWHCVSCDEGQSDDDDRYSDEDGNPLCGSCAYNRVKAYSLLIDAIVHVDSDVELYDSELTRFSRYADALHLGGISPAYYGLAVLNDDLYDGNYYGMLAPRDQVIAHHEDNYVREDDLDEFDLVEIDGIAYPAHECFMLDGERRHDPDFDPDAEGVVPADVPFFASYPNLPHYATVAEEPAIEEAV